MTEADDRDTTDEQRSQDSTTNSDLDGDIPTDAVDEAERLTRLARDAVDENEAEAYRERRVAVLDEFDYRARVREDDSRDVLVVHPDEWMEDGLVRVDCIDDVDRGIERPLSGPGEADDWEVVADHNREIAETVAAEHGGVHGKNAAAFAEFMSNHYARAIESATDDDVDEFLTEYFPRNVWPDDDAQRDRLEESIELTLEIADGLTRASE